MRDRERGNEEKVKRGGGSGREERERGRGGREIMVERKGVMQILPIMTVIQSEHLITPFYMPNMRTGLIFQNMKFITMGRLRWILRISTFKILSPIITKRKRRSIRNLS
jgi:hypothetical protein